MAIDLMGHYPALGRGRRRPWTPIRLPRIRGSGL